MKYNTMQDNKMQCKAIRMVLKPSVKWEMILKSPDSFDTVLKMGNDLEKSGRL